MYLCHRLKRHNTKFAVGVRIACLNLFISFGYMVDVSLIGFVDSRLWEKDTLHTIMTITELKSVTSIENRKKDKPMGMDTLTLFC